MPSCVTPIGTIGRLAAAPPGWVFVWCGTPGCGHYAAVALAPLVIRWGPEAPRAWMLSRFRCRACGRRGTRITLPSMLGSHGHMAFPAERALRT